MKVENMKILKLTIVGLIISQSVFAGYGKAIVGGAVGGVVAGVVTNAVSKNTNNTSNSTNSTYTEPSKGNGGSLVMDCYCPYSLVVHRTSSETTVRCYNEDKTKFNVLLHGGSNGITVIPHESQWEYCVVSK